MKRLPIIQIIVTLFILALAMSAVSQTTNMFNQRDDKYTLLGLKRAKQDYETAKTEYEMEQSLFDKGHSNQVSLDRARNRYIDAEVNYQQSLLAVLFEDQYITISKAVKYQAQDGTKHARVTLANTSGGTAEFKKLINVDDQLFRTLQPDVIPNVYISILNDDQAIISQPYEAKINELIYGSPVTIDFALLQDLDQVNISMIYGNGTQRTMKVFLQKDESVDRVLVQSEQFSQEVDLGSSTSFDLTLELFSGTSNTFSLEVLNLPRQISRYFKSRNGDVRLTQVKFTESSRTKSAALQITLPDRPNDEVIMDKSIPFYVLVMPRDKLKALGDPDSKIWTEEEIKKLEVGYVRLELVPRGKGDLLVRAPQLYHSIEADQTAEVTMNLLNEGSNRLDNIEFKVDLPLNWSKTIDPESVSKLEIGSEKKAILSIIPPDDVAAGKYNIRVRFSAMSNGQPVTVEDKTITVEIKSETSIVGTLLILLLIGLLIGGIVYYGMRLSKK